MGKKNETWSDSVPSGAWDSSWYVDWQSPTRKWLYLTNDGIIFWTFCSWVKHCLQHCTLCLSWVAMQADNIIFSLIYIYYKGSENKMKIRLCSAWRSTPTTGGADTAELITWPKTATSFTRISIDKLACLAYHIKRSP